MHLISDQWISRREPPGAYVYDGGPRLLTKRRYCKGVTPLYLRGAAAKPTTAPGGKPEGITAAASKGAAALCGGNGCVANWDGGAKSGAPGRTCSPSWLERQRG